MKNRVIILFLLFMLTCFFTYKCLHLLNKQSDCVVKLEQKVDTVIIYDTITQYIPKYVYKQTIDTLYLPTNDQPVINLPIEQTHYANNGVYDVWISGYHANLDSIKTYPRIEYRTITNNVTKEIYKNTLDLYAYTGFRRFDHRVGQVIGLTIKTPKKWIISGEFGVMDNKVVYGMHLGLKLN